MNKREFSRVVAEENGMTYQDSTWATNAVFNTLKNLLKTQDKVSLYGFGTFRVVERKEKTFRHPTTGEVSVRPPYRGVKFTPSEPMVDEINTL